jgi:hypothetical protein
MRRFLARIYLLSMRSQSENTGFSRMCSLLKRFQTQLEQPNVAMCFVKCKQSADFKRAELHSQRSKTT